MAVGKSTTARVLKALLARWPDHPRVDLITTDGFLYPNAELERRGLMDRKGFPESFDTARLLNFLHDVKSGRANVAAPVYSHFHYDIIPGQATVIDRPDVLIVEGLNVLQPARMPKGGEAIPFVSDFFNFSIYMDADAQLIEDWYVTRFMRLRQTAFRDPAAYFHRYAHLAPDEARAKALEIWRTINEKNLEREHPAHAPARPPHPAQGPQPQDRERGAAPDLIASRRTVSSAKRNRSSAVIPGLARTRKSDRCALDSSDKRRDHARGDDGPSSPFARASSASDTSGRAPMWEMISAAARLPRPAGRLEVAPAAMP